MNDPYARSDETDKWGYSAGSGPATDLRHPETLARALEHSLNEELIREKGGSVVVDNVRIEVELIVDGWASASVEKMLYLLKSARNSRTGRELLGVHFAILVDGYGGGNRDGIELTKDPGMQVGQIKALTTDLQYINTKFDFSTNTSVLSVSGDSYARTASLPPPAVLYFVETNGDIRRIRAVRGCGRMKDEQKRLACLNSR